MHIVDTQKNFHLQGAPCSLHLCWVNQLIQKSTRKKQLRVNYINTCRSHGTKIADRQLGLRGIYPNRILSPDANQLALLWIILGGSACGYLHSLWALKFCFFPLLGFRTQEQLSDLLMKTEKKKMRRIWTWSLRVFVPRLSDWMSFPQNILFRWSWTKVSSRDDLSFMLKHFVVTSL